MSELHFEHAHALPDEKKALFARARRLEWITIVALLSVVVVVGLTAGNSQAMKTAWIEDMLSLIPPISFLVAARFRHREANERFPYGYHRSLTLAFLGSSLALTTMGTLLFFESAAALVRAEHPTIGTVRVFGTQVWQGWLMIAASVYGVIPSVLLGRKKFAIAPELHDKALHTDGDMNKADWQTGLATILGIIGIGFGLFWADAVAAMVISASILRDGLGNTRAVFADLMDQTPFSVDHRHALALPRTIERELRKLPWVRDARARLRENGHLFVGEVLIVPTTDRPSLDHVTEAREHIEELDWRTRDVVVALVPRL